MNMENIIEQLSNMTVLQAIELSKKLEQVWGVSAAVAVAAPQSSEAAQEAEKTEFDVVITALGDEKLKVIKAVKDLTGLGLKEAKDLVEKPLPVKVKESLPKADAEQIVSKLKEAGAAAEVK